MPRRLPLTLSTLLAASGAFAAAGCRTAQAPVQPAATQSLPSPEEALALLRGSGEARQNLRALGRVTYFGDRGRVRLKAVILAERPGRFRVETLSPFEQPVDVMVSDGDQLWLVSEDRLRTGAATPENIARLIPLAMRPEEVVDTFLGGVPGASGFAPTGIEAGKGGTWVIALRGPAGEPGRLVMDPVRKVVQQMDLLEPSGEPRVQVRFGDFAASGPDGRELPRDIVVEMPARKLDVRIKLGEVDVNVPLDASLFRIEPPPGVEVESFEAALAAP